MMFRRRLQVTSNWTYYDPAARSAAATSSRSGFDNGYTPEDVTTTRVDNVNLTWRSLQGTADAAGRPGAT